MIRAKYCLNHNIETLYHDDLILLDDDSIISGNKLPGDDISFTEHDEYDYSKVAGKVYEALGSVVINSSPLNTSQKNHIGEEIVLLDSWLIQLNQWWYSFSESVSMSDNYDFGYGPGATESPTVLLEESLLQLQKTSENFLDIASLEKLDVDFKKLISFVDIDDALGVNMLNDVPFNDGSNSTDPSLRPMVLYEEYSVDLNTVSGIETLVIGGSHLIQSDSGYNEDINISEDPVVDTSRDVDEPVSIGEDYLVKLN